MIIISLNKRERERDDDDDDKQNDRNRLSVGVIHELVDPFTRCIHASFSREGRSDAGCDRTLSERCLAELIKWGKSPRSPAF